MGIAVVKEFCLAASNAVITGALSSQFQGSVIEGATASVASYVFGRGLIKFGGKLQDCLCEGCGNDAFDNLPVHEKVSISSLTGAAGLYALSWINDRWKMLALEVAATSVATFCILEVFKRIHNRCRQGHAPVPAIPLFNIPALLAANSSIQPTPTHSPSVSSLDDDEV